MEKSKIVSLYEGFFSGGARILHTDVVIGLQEKGYEQAALSINDQTYRENTLQSMENDRSYQRLDARGIAIASLGRKARGEVDYSPFTTEELDAFARQTEDADLIFSVKEQPVRILNQIESLNTPVIVGLHRSDPEHQGQSIDHLRYALETNRIAGFIATAESAKRAYASIGVPENMVHVIRNGIDLDRFMPSPEKRARMRNELGVMDDSPVVVFAARFDPMKDVPLFLDSARTYLSEEPAATILMCGAGMTIDNPEMQQALEKTFVHTPELLEHVRLLGIRADMETIYAGADVVSSTSSFGETYPLCLMEGLACGAIPVATDVGDSYDIAGESRGIITPRQPEAIAAAWQYAFDARSDFLEAIRATRFRFSRERMIGAYASIIGEYI